MNATGLIYATNNVFAYNGQTDWTVTSIPTSVPNWSADGLNAGAAFHGNPMLLNTNLTLSYAFPAGTSIRDKHDSLDRQIRQALSPALGSPLLASGLVVQGYQLPSADNDPNNPMSLTAPGTPLEDSRADHGRFRFVHGHRRREASAGDRPSRCHQRLLITIPDRARYSVRAENFYRRERRKQRISVFGFVLFVSFCFIYLR